MRAENAEKVLDGETHEIVYRRCGQDVFFVWEAVLLEQGVEKLAARGDCIETALYPLEFEMRLARRR